MEKSPDGFHQLVPATRVGVIVTTFVLDGIELPHGDPTTVQEIVSRFERAICELDIVGYHWPFKGVGAKGPSLEDAIGQILAIADEVGKADVCRSILAGER